MINSALSNAQLRNVDDHFVVSMILFASILMSNSVEAMVHAFIGFRFFKLMMAFVVVELAITMILVLILVGLLLVFNVFI